ncbi:MAG: hypothetical protein KAI70_07055 [Candidatus Omnitrophica bacterium]|nr:hypothetical protein [Candidatus Omnitrophota bacterium]
MIECDSDNVDVKAIDKKISITRDEDKGDHRNPAGIPCGLPPGLKRGLDNKVNGDLLIELGFKVKYFDYSWNLMFADGSPLCQLNATGTKRDALKEALRYIKVKKIK